MIYLASSTGSKNSPSVSSIGSSTDSHDDQFPVFDWDIGVGLIVYILLQKHIGQVWIIAHDTVRVHEFAAAGNFQFL